ERRSYASESPLLTVNQQKAERSRLKLGGEDRAEPQQGGDRRKECRRSGITHRSNLSTAKEKSREDERGRCGLFGLVEKVSA
ncbi:hypothetical protein JZ751_006022, partial [Albula glossodonta]